MRRSLPARRLLRRLRAVVGCVAVARAGRTWLVTSRPSGEILGGGGRRVEAVRHALRAVRST